MKFQNFLKKHTVKFSRFSLFLIYFWFGVLKIFGQSPASQLVKDLFDVTLSNFLSFSTFFVLFSFFEIAIGISFLFPKLTKISLYATFLHIITTFIPLLFLSNQTWSALFVPTFEGQYIIKNLLIISLALMIFKDYNKN